MTGYKPICDKKTNHINLYLKDDDIVLMKELMAKSGFKSTSDFIASMIKTVDKNQVYNESAFLEEIVLLNKEIAFLKETVESHTDRIGTLQTRLQTLSRYQK